MPEKTEVLLENSIHLLESNIDKYSETISRIEALLKISDFVLGALGIVIAVLLAIILLRLFTTDKEKNEIRKEIKKDISAEITHFHTITSEELLKKYKDNMNEINEEIQSSLKKYVDDVTNINRGSNNTEPHDYNSLKTELESIDDTDLREEE